MELSKGRSESFGELAAAPGDDAPVLRRRSSLLSADSNRAASSLRGVCQPLTTLTRVAHAVVAAALSPPPVPPPPSAPPSKTSAGLVKSHPPLKFELFPSAARHLSQALANILRVYSTQAVRRLRAYASALSAAASAAIPAAGLGHASRVDDRLGLGGGGRLISLGGLQDALVMRGPRTVARPAIGTNAEVF
jgi:hypothetical protein